MSSLASLLVVTVNSPSLAMVPPRVAAPLEVRVTVAPELVAVMAAVGVFAAIFNPARNATIPQIVPLRQLQSGNALIFGIAVIASMIGLGVGGRMFDPKLVDLFVEHFDQVMDIRRRFPDDD